MIRPGLSGRRGVMLRALVFSIATFVAFSPPRATAAEVHGTVTDPDGRTVPGARVIVTGSRPDALGTDTDTGGRFTLAGLPAGTYELRVVLPGFTAEPMTVVLVEDAPGEVSIRLRVSALAESLVVSAAQTDLPLSQAASTITVVSGADLDARQVRAVGDALAYVPGLNVARNGGLNSLTSLFTRGGESDFTLVLLDGMRVNAFGGGLDLSQVPLVDVDRIEIVRGPQSALFGSDAIGGVIQIVSRQGAHEQVDGLIEGGSLGTVRARVGASGGTDAWSWNTRADQTRSDGFTGSAPATGERVSNDDGRASHAGFGAGWRNPSGAAVRGSAQLSWTERGFPGPYGSNPIGAYTTVDRVSRGNNTRRQMGLQWAQPWTGAAGRVRQRTTFALADFDSTFVSPFGVSESESRRVSVRSQADAALSSALGLSAGVEVQRERAGSTFITGNAFEPVPVQRWLTGYFAEARLAPARRVSIATGVRVEQIRRDALDSNPSPFGGRPRFDADTVVSANPKISMAYLLRDAEAGGNPTRLRLSAGTGIRPPDAFEIAFTDNPGLRPERSRSLDVGVQQTLGGGAGIVEATVFVNSYDDLIISVGTSFRDASRFRTDNISNARSRGLELAAGVRPTAGINLRGSYTWLDTEILDVDGAAGLAPSPFTVGETLIRRPRHQGSVSATYVTSRVSAFLEAVFRGTVRDIEPSFGAFGGVFTADGYCVAHAGASVAVTRGVQVLARVENLGNARHEEAFGFPAPGRVVMVGLRLATGR